MRLLLWGALGAGAWYWWKSNKDKALREAASDTYQGARKAVQTVRAL